jgi:hypothetical protein
LEYQFKKFGKAERKITGRVNRQYNEIIEDGFTYGFPFAVSFESMQQHLFKFEETK